MNQAGMDAIIVVLTWVACAGVQWGIISTKVKGIETRLDKIEDTKFLTREEYQARHSELQAQMAEMRRVMIERTK